LNSAEIVLNKSADQLYQTRGTKTPRAYSFPC